MSPVVYCPTKLRLGYLFLSFRLLFVDFNYAYGLAQNIAF